MRLKKSVQLQLNKMFIRFITVLLIPDMRQCFRFDSLYVTDTWHSLFTFHFVHVNCLRGFVQINTIQYNTIQYNTM